MMMMKELEAETVTYHGKDYRVWNVVIDGYDVAIGEIDLERAILGWDCEPVDEEGRILDDRMGYYADPTEEVEDVIRFYRE